MNQQKLSADDHITATNKKTAKTTDLQPFASETPALVNQSRTSDQISRQNDIILARLAVKIEQTSALISYTAALRAQKSAKVKKNTATTT